jgi:phage/plasmid-associated DNA primase
MTNDPGDQNESSYTLIGHDKQATEQREQERARSNCGAAGADAALEGDVLPPELHGFPLTEDGVAQAFAIERRNDLRYCHGPNRWYHWDSTRWVVDGTKLTFNWIRELARRMARTSIDPKAPETLGKASFVSAVERLAQSDRTFAVRPDVWDRDPWLLGTPGGTVDLRSGALHPPSRADYRRVTRFLTGRHHLRSNDGAGHRRTSAGRARLDAESSGGQSAAFDRRGCRAGN